MPLVLEQHRLGGSNAAPYIPVAMGHLDLWTPQSEMEYEACWMDDLSIPGWFGGMGGACLLETSGIPDVCHPLLERH